MLLDSPALALFALTGGSRALDAQFAERPVQAAADLTRSSDVSSATAARRAYSSSTAEVGGRPSDVKPGVIGQLPSRALLCPLEADIANTP
ncbi:hypothetical protein AURDEDRAFT_160754 [Auricularia subglabra TFB-10046 SS5]|nr:hypothetical protein AURDEDRAFT_160754 [Auricularia subglabra TFB-10046 SS5]